MKRAVKIKALLSVIFICGLFAMLSLNTVFADVPVFSAKTISQNEIEVMLSVDCNGDSNSKAWQVKLNDSDIKVIGATPPDGGKTIILILEGGRLNSTGETPTVTYVADKGDITAVDGGQEIEDNTQAVCTDGIAPKVTDFRSENTGIFIKDGADVKLSLKISEKIASTTGPALIVTLPDEEGEVILSGQENSGDPEGKYNKWNYNWTVDCDTNGLVKIEVGDFNDDAGNAYQKKEGDKLELYIDNTAPTVESITYADEYGPIARPKFRAGETITIMAGFSEKIPESKPPKVFISYGGDPEIADMTKTSDPSDKVYAYQLTLPENAKGTGSFYINASDQAGNSVQTDTVSFEFDNTVPSFTLNLGGTAQDGYISKAEWEAGFNIMVKLEGDQTSDGQATFYVVPSDTAANAAAIDAAKIASQLGTYMEDTIQFASSVDNIEDDTTYVVYAVDEYGNVSEPAEVFTVYRTLPTVTVSYGDSSQYIKKGEKFTITASSNRIMSYVKYEIEFTGDVADVTKETDFDITKQEKTEDTYTYTATEGNGAGTIRVTVRDAAGNAATAEKPNAFNVDNTPPQQPELESQTIGSYGPEVWVKAFEEGTLYLAEYNEDDPVPPDENRLKAEGQAIPVTQNDINKKIYVIVYPKGDYTKLYAVDEAGNISEPSVGTLTRAAADAIDLTFTDDDIDGVYYYNKDEISFTVNKYGLPALPDREADKYAIQIIGEEFLPEDGKNITRYVGEEYDHFVKTDGYECIVGTPSGTTPSAIEFETAVATDRPEFKDYIILYGSVNDDKEFTPFVVEKNGENVQLTAYFKGSRNGVQMGVKPNFLLGDAAHAVPDGVTATDLRNVDNIRAVPDLHFLKEGVLEVTVNSPIDLLSDEASVQLPNLLKMRFVHGGISINSTELSFIARYGADITMYGIEEYDRVSAYSDDGELLDTDELISDLTYDPEAKTLSFTVEHFTTYQAQVQLAAPAKPSISGGTASWTAVQNENNGYALQLFKNGAAVGAPIIVGTGVATYDMTSVISSNGTGSYTVKVTALGKDFYFDSEQSPASDAYSYTASTSGGDNSGGTSGGGAPVTTPPAQTGNGTAIQTVINGVASNIATAVTTAVGGVNTTTIAVDDDIINELIGNSDTGVTISIPSNSNAQVVIGTLAGDTLASMAEKSAVLEIATDDTTFVLPTDQIDLDAVAQQLGADAADMQVSVRIADPSDEDVSVVESAAGDGGYEILVRPVEFEITCTAGGRTVEISEFNGYVERLVAIPDGVDPERVTTAVVLNDDGTFSHVPTRIVEIDGKYYASISSMTNSIYTVISNTRSFDDISSHWAKADIIDMGSRLIIDGDGKGSFNPEREITRAEFSAIIVRALGLLRNEAGTAVFSDVPASKWYFDAVSLAGDYKLIEGDGKLFRPESKITRQEAMVIIARAMSLADIDTSVENAGTYLDGYTDSASISGWARDQFAACIKNKIVQGSNNAIRPNDNITRAEAAAIIKRMLAKAGII